MKKNIFLYVLLLITTAALAQPAKESYDKGISLKNGDQYEDALAAFRKTISLDANYTNAYYQAGWCCNELEKYEDALGYLNKFNPGNNDDIASKYVEIGYAYFNLENDDDAIKAYTTALDYHPYFGNAYRGLANVYLNSMEYENALENLELAIKYDEENSKQLYYKLGSFYNDMEKYDKAENILQKAVVYDPQSEESLIALGYTYFKLSKFNDGILQTNKAIFINPKSRLGYHYLANCYMGLNQKEKAMQAYNKLKAFDEDEAAILLEEMGN